MKYLNKINLSFAFVILMLVFTSCKKDFLDVNNDPNRVTENNVTPELIFTQAEVSVGNRVVGGSAAAAGAKLPTQFLQDWVGYMAANGDFARDQQETTYDLDFGFGDRLWQDNYNTLFDLYQAKQKALASGSDTALAGASMILSAYLFQNLVDLFGNIPYSQAFQTNTFPNPAYDDAQDIYNSLLLSLDTAINYMNTSVTTAFENADVINQGDVQKWIKFANTIKLRLLIRQSEVSGFDPSNEIAKIESSGGVLGAGESVSVNPGYSNDVNKQSPFYANYGYTPTGTKATTSTNANAYIIDILSSNNDPRIERFFQPVSGDFIGNVFGDEPGNLYAGSQSSYFGPGIIRDPTQDQWIMPSFESMFLKAEAIARGWMDGDAKTAYEEAVTESFVWLDVTDAESEAQTYMEDNAIANWDNAGSTAEAQSKFIVFQKYIALTCIDPLEAYSDQRRLHFLPAGFLSVNVASANKLPIRLLYPQSEYTTNAVSVKQVGTIDPFATKIFWEP